MKKVILIMMVVFAGMALSAQNQEAISRVSNQMNVYFGNFPKEKIFISTNKSLYKPGETIWFRAFVTDENNLPDTKASNELFVKLFDSKGKPVIQELFRLKNGSAPGDLMLPDDLAKGIYFLFASTSASQSPEEITYLPLVVDPIYNNQLFAAVTMKDSISISGQKNEMYLEVKDLSGELQKNTNIRYQFMNGNLALEKGKLKTDSKGKLIIPFTLPAKSNGEPFTCELSDNREDLKMLRFIPSDLDPITVKFYPEGGNLIPGVQSKIGFTAFNKWGIPVDIEGFVQNQEGKPISPVKTFTKGLGLFSIENGSDQKYKLVISGTSGHNQSFELPAPSQNGLALSVPKTDAGFVTAGLNFADKQKHAVALAVTRGRNIYWAADMEIDKSGRIKIPTDNIPQGVSLLTVFNASGDWLAERIVYVDRKQELKITVQPDRISLPTGENMKVKVRLTDENNKPVKGNVSINITDRLHLEVPRTTITENLLVSSELETPFSIISGAMKGKITSTTLLDVYLISNNLKGFSWAKIMGFKKENKLPDNSQPKADSNNQVDAALSAYIADYAMKFNLLPANILPDAGFFANNEDFFQKSTKAFKNNNIPLENQRKMLESSSSILDVIKTLKPYKLEGNMIVFIGSENSLTHQGGALIVLDGLQLGTDISALANISPMDIDHINVSTNAMDIQRYTGLNSVGIIEIFMKTGTKKEDKKNTETTDKYDHGYRIPGIFPDAPENPKRDTRTTLLWIPEKSVDENGQFELIVTAGRLISDYVIEIEGISENGRLGSGKANFSVTR